MGIYPNTAILLITFVCLLISVLTGSRSEDVDKWEATVKALESLVRRNPAATREVNLYELGYKRVVLPFAVMRRLNMPVEQKTWLMCNWVKGTHSQAFSLEVEGNGCLEGEAQGNREAAKVLAAPRHLQCSK